MTNTNTEMKADTIDMNSLERDGIATYPERDSRQKTLVSVDQVRKGHQIQIVANDGEVLADRYVGNILINGNAIGDVGYLVDGSLFVTGRKEDLIVRVGRTHYPQDIEAIVAGIRGVEKTRIVAFGIPMAGNTVKIVVAAETRTVDSRDLSRIEANIRFALSKALCMEPMEVILVAAGTLAGRQAAKALYASGELAHSRVVGVQVARPAAKVATTETRRGLARLVPASLLQMFDSFGLVATA